MAALFMAFLIISCSLHFYLLSRLENQLSQIEIQLQQFKKNVDTPIYHIIEKRQAPEFYYDESQPWAEEVEPFEGISI
jgi:hypothetical protein